MNDNKYICMQELNIIINENIENTIKGNGKIYYCVYQNATAYEQN